MTTDNTNTPPDLDNIADQQVWLSERYFRLDRDDALSGLLQNLFQVDNSGNLTATPVRDPLNGETAGLMLIGASGNGKSALLHRTLRTHPIFTRITPKNPGNTLVVTVPPEATIKSLANMIAKQTGYVEMSSRIRAHEAWDVARHRMRKMWVTLLVIDEAHHLLRKGSGRDVEGAVQTLKNLLQGESSVAVILAGVPKLREAILLDPETDRRFIKYQLRRLNEGSDEAKRFASCIALCAEKLGLSLPPELNFADRVLFAEGGQAGRSIKLAKQTMRCALAKGTGVIDLNDAAQCFENLYGEMPLSPFAPADWPALRKALISGGWAR